MNSILNRPFYYIIEISKNILITLLIILYSCENGSAQRQAPNKTTKASKTIKKSSSNNKSDLILAPDFTLASLEGNQVSMNQFKGKVILLNFWGTWCGPCRVEIPDFVKLTEKYKDQGLEIVGVTLTSGPPNRISSFADQWDINYTLLTDVNVNETQTVVALYGQATGKRITGVPTTFLIDREGLIRQTYVGPRSEAVFYRDLKPYL